MLASHFRIRLTAKRLEIRDIATDASLSFPPCITVDANDVVTSIGDAGASAMSCGTTHTPFDSVPATPRDRQLAWAILQYAIERLQSERPGPLRWLRLSPRIEFVLSRELAHLRGFLADSRQALGARSMAVEVMG